MRSKSVVRLCRNGLNSAVHFDLSSDSRSVYNEPRYVEKRRATPCRLPSQPRASGEDQTAQVAGWSFLQSQIHSAQEASGCRYTAERHIPVERIWKMWPVAIFLMLVVAFYWGAFYISVVAWLNAIGHLFRGNFIRASIWFSIGVGMLLWWQGSDIIPDPWDFDKWLHG